MNVQIVHTDTAVLLIGGGECTDSVLSAHLAQAKIVVAADGGAARVMALGRMPDAVIGDMDSLDPALQAQLPPGVLHRIAEQDSTDFGKCLRAITAPVVLAYGFLGKRLDHQLAAMTVLARHPERPCILIGPEDVAVLCPPRLALALPAGCRVSLYPLGAVTGRSGGLRWPIGGLDFAPDGVIGTSNEALGPVTLEMDGPGMVLILPAEFLSVLQEALVQAPARWPVRAG